jgi:hypothetical protein
MFALRAFFSTLADLFAFLAQRKRWWLLPLVLVLLLFSALIVLGSAAGIGPFIYTLF